MDFPTELGILTCLALFAASMWIPFVVGIVKVDAPEDANGFNRPADLTRAPAWVHRAHRAHLNLLEQLVPFAILVLIVDRVDGFSTLTYWTAIVFFWLRIFHAFGMISGKTMFPARSMIFNAGWICTLIMGASVFIARF